MTAAVTPTAGRPRNPGLDCAILAAAEQQLRELGYARMPLDSAAAAAGTQSADPEVPASMLIGSFYARYLGAPVIPDDWAERTLRQARPDQRHGL